MHGCARDLNALLEGGLMHVQAIKPLAAERRDERRMHVDYFVMPFLTERVGQHGHKPGQHDKPHAELGKQLMQGCAIALRAVIFLPAEHVGRDKGALGALERICVRVG